MKNGPGFRFFLGGILLSLFFLGGCAGSKTYLLHFDYDASKTPLFVIGKSVTVVVYNFQDVRPDPLYLGRRVYRDGMVDFFKPDDGTVEQIVTRSFIRLLQRAGFTVKPMNRYLNPEKEDFKEIPGDAAFGGKIQALWVEAKTGLATTDSNATMNIQAHWGLVKERTWITKTMVADAQETDRPFYKPQNAEGMINGVLKDCLDKLLKEDTMLKGNLLKNK